MQNQGPGALATAVIVFFGGAGLMVGAGIMRVLWIMAEHIRANSDMAWVLVVFGIVAVLFGLNGIENGFIGQTAVALGRVPAKLVGKMHSGDPIDVESRSVDIDHRRAMTAKELEIADHYARRDLPRQAPDFRAQLERANGSGRANGNGGTGA